MQFILHKINGLHFINLINIEKKNKNYQFEVKEHQNLESNRLTSINKIIDYLLHTLNLPFYFLC